MADAENYEIKGQKNVAKKLLKNLQISFLCRYFASDFEFRERFRREIRVLKNISIFCGKYFAVQKSCSIFAVALQKKRMVLIEFFLTFYAKNLVDWKSCFTFAPLSAFENRNFEKEILRPSGREINLRSLRLLSS